MVGSSKKSKSDKGVEKDGIRWNEPDTLTFLRLVLDMQKKNGFASIQWGVISKRLKEVLGREISGEKLKNKYSHMKARHTLWWKLRYHVIGAGWDPDLHKVTASDEWWDRQTDEKFYQFRKMPLSREMSELWDGLFEKVAATGIHAQAPSGNRTDIVVAGSDEVSSDDVSVDTTEENDDATTALDDSQDHNVIDQPSSQVQDKGKSYTPSPTGPSPIPRKRKKTPGSKLFYKSCEMVSHASATIADSITSSGTSKAEQNAEYDMAMSQLYSLVDTGLLQSPGTVFCYAVTELAKENRRGSFMRLRSDEEKVAWLEQEYTMMIARFPK